MKTRATMPFIMLTCVLLLSVPAARAQITYAPTEENLRTLAEDDGHLAVVQRLLTRGVSPNAPDWRGRTAVHVAAKHGAVQNLEALLQAGGDPNVPDQDGHTPLHVAIKEGGRDGRTEIVKVLLARNADPCVRDAEGHVPSHYAIVQEHAALRQVLDLAGGHDRACTRPAVASAAPADATIRDAVRDPWADEASDPYQDIWGQPASPEADPWGQETVWEQVPAEAENLTDDPAEDEAADADYTAALYAVLGDPAARDTQTEDYVGAMAALEERARQRSEAEARRQAAETERETERQRLAALEQERWEQEAWEQEEREREAWERQRRERDERMRQDLANQTAKTFEMLRDMRERKERQQREYHRQAERQRREAEQQRREYEQQAERQRQEAERQRQEAERQRREYERQAEQQRQEAERQRQAQAKHARLKAAAAAHCLQTRRSKRTIVTKRGALGFDRGHIEIRNTCSRRIIATGFCLDGETPTKNSPYEGTYYFPKGFGSLDLRPGVWRIHPSGEICNDRGYGMSHIACTAPFTPYYTSPNGSSYQCFD